MSTSSLNGNDQTAAADGQSDNRHSHVVDANALNDRTNGPPYEISGNTGKINPGDVEEEQDFSPQVTLGLSVLIKLMTN